MMGYGLFRMLCGSLFYLLILAALVALIVLAVRAWSNGWGSRTGYTAPSAGAPNRALEILQERYARGEITKDQYDEMRRDLSG